MQSAAIAVEDAVRQVLAQGGTKEQAVEAGRKVAERYSVRDLTIADIALTVDQLRRR